MREGLGQYILLQLLCGKLLLHVALVAGHAQVLSDGCHEGHGSAVLLHLSRLLFHMDLVSTSKYLVFYNVCI